MPNALIVAFLVLLAFCGRGAEAAAPECLSAVDDMIVEYDIPISGQVPGAQAGSPSTPSAGPGAHGQRTAPPRAPSGRRTSEPPGRHALGAAQRKRLQSALQLARTAEARGDEAQCMDILRQARRIVAPAR